MSSVVSLTLTVSVHFYFLSVRVISTKFVGAFSAGKDILLKNFLTLVIQAQKERGIIAASAGNHALALAYHGRELNIPVTVVMPLNAPIMKINTCRKFGAKVHVMGGDIIEVVF